MAVVVVMVMVVVGGVRVGGGNEQDDGKGELVGSEGVPQRFQTSHSNDDIREANAGK